MNEYLVGLLFAISWEAWWALMVLVSILERRAGIIPVDEPKFTHWVAVSIGDPVFLPFLNFAVGTLVAREGINAWIVALPLFVGAIATHYSTFVQSKMPFTITEVFHNVYFAVQIVAVIFWVWFGALAILQRNGENTALLLCGLFGMAGYAATHWLDDLKKRGALKN